MAETSVAAFDGPRACEALEMGPTVDLLNLVFFRDHPGIGHYAPQVWHQANREQMRIIKADGRVVAHAGGLVAEARTGRGSFRLGLIWGVASHPDFRRQGLGEACVRAAMDRLAELGCEVGWLGTGIFDWYRRLGWERAGQGYLFRLDAGNVGLLPEAEGYELEESCSPEVEEMAALYEQAGVGLVRPLELWPVLLQRGGGTGRCLTAARGGRLVAYALLHEGKVIEYAGAEQAVLGLLRRAWELQAGEDQSASLTAGRGVLEVSTPVREAGVPRRLRDLGLPRRREPRGMMWIADLPGLLGKLGLAGEVTAEESPDSVTLRRGAEEVTLPRPGLVKLLFGPERVADFAPDLFPLDFYHWRTDMV